MDNKWTVVPFGSYARDFLNACLDLAEADDDNVAALLGVAEEMAGVKGDEAITNIYWPTLLLALELLSVKDFEIEFLYRIGKKESTTGLRPYITGQDSALVGEWWLAIPQPYILPPGNKIGLLCACDTVARAAIAELVIAFTLNKKIALRFCKKCCRFYCGDKCERCRPAALLKSKFLNLLGQHKYRYKDYPGLAQDIDKLKKCLTVGECDLSVSVRKYKVMCQEYKIPTRWAAGYSVIFKENQK